MKFHNLKNFQTLDNFFNKKNHENFPIRYYNFVSYQIRHLLNLPSLVQFLNFDF